MQKLAAVVGYPIQHSLSPILHKAGWGADFQSIAVHSGQLADFLLTLPAQYVGLAVTMPLKHEACRLAQLSDGLAKVLGVVNTLVFQPTGNTSMLVGFNTDVAGIANSLTAYGVGSHDSALVKSALILGSGATASSALAALIQLQIAQITVSARRKAGINTVFSAAHRLHLPLEAFDLDLAVPLMLEKDLTISTLPSMVTDGFAKELASVATLDLRGKFLLDCSYDSYPSQLVQVWENNGGIVVPGYELLFYQAVEQAKLFTGRVPDIAAMRYALDTALAERGIIS